MVTKKDLQRRFKIGHNTVYRTLQACPLGTKKQNYTEAEIQQYFAPARQMLTAGKTYKEVEQYFALNQSPPVQLSEPANLKTHAAVNVATAIKPLGRDNEPNYSNVSKRFRIKYSTSQASARLAKVSNRECTTSYSQMSPTIQTIHQTGGVILSITEVP